MALQEVNLQLEQPMLYCPVTGMLVSDGVNETDPSPALLFCYLHVVGEFHYIRPDIEEKFQKVCEALEEEGNVDDYPYEVLLKREQEKIALIT